MLSFPSGARKPQHGIILSRATDRRYSRCAAGSVFSSLPVTGKVRWTPQRLVWSGLLMAWSEQPQLVERFHAVCAFLKQTCKHWKIGSSYDGWVAAQLREAERIRPLVVRRLREQMRQIPTTCPNSRFELFAVDGSKAACPRTIENQAAMGDVGKPDGIPQLSLTSLLHLQTGLPWDFRVGSGTDSERGHLREMLDELPQNALLVADAGFIGYELCCEMIERRQRFLLRVGGNIHLLQELSEEYEVRGNTVYLWPVKQQDRNQPPIQLRLIVIREAGKEPVYLVTNVLDENELSDDEAAVIYRLRWGIEVQFRTVKQTMQHHTMHSRTPATCYLEMTWAYLGVWLLELMTARRVAQSGGNPQRISPAAARNTVRRVLRHQRPDPRDCRNLPHALSACRLDDYERKKTKASRNYPRKKRHKPPDPPKIKPLNPQQLQKLKQLTPIRLLE
jgi:hypothetical protein